MTPGEISQEPRKDSMGMEMVPVYEGEENTATISIDPVTTQNMGLRTGIVTKGPLRKVIRTVANIDGFAGNTGTEGNRNHHAGFAARRRLDYPQRRVVGAEDHCPHRVATDLLRRELAGLQVDQGEVPR